jgi:hypothetical protein
MNNIDKYRVDIRYELESLLRAMHKLAEAINTAVPHVLYKHDIFNNIKNQGLFLIDQYRILTISHDSKIIDKSIILETNISIIKERIYTLLSTINENNIIHEES